MKIVVFDDDPTGSQTVHDCPLLLSWNVDEIRNALRHSSKLLFLLANTRALMPEEAATRNREICLAVSTAIKAEGIDLKNVLIVSRGDSTLRGHGFLEPAIINEELGPFDATFHVPALLECGRTTVNGVHLLNGVPVHTTPFGKDHCFGYSTSDLAAWLEEKSFGSIKKETVKHISLSRLNAASNSASGFKHLESWLRSLERNQMVVVDAELPAHLKCFGKAVRNLQKEKRFLFRSAASLINGLSDLESKYLTSQNLLDLRRRDKQGKILPGMVIVGSYMPLSDIQLAYLLEKSDCLGVELPVELIIKNLESTSRDLSMDDLESILEVKLRKILKSGKTPVLYTSRGEANLSTSKERLLLGSSLASLIASLVRKICPHLGYLISKGGITTNTILTQGLQLEVVKLEGQILPGLSLVLPAKWQSDIRFPIITFPGNLGGESTLLEAWKLMETC